MEPKTTKKPSRKLVVFKRELPFYLMLIKMCIRDRRYTVAGQDYIVQNGVSRCANGTLDGGGVYLDGAVRNLSLIHI